MLPFSVFLCISLFSTTQVYAEQASDEIATMIQKNSKDPGKPEFNLSPYELAMMTDLVIQISVFRCSLVSRPGMKSLKQYIFSTFSKAPGNKGVSHPLFYSNYRSLVECLNYVQDAFPKGSISMIKARRRRRSSISEEFNSLIPTGQEGFEKFRKKTNQNWDDLFDSFQGIVKLSCPPYLSPNYEFLFQSLLEVSKWIDNHDMKNVAHQKYLSKGRIGEQIENCNKLVLKNALDND